MSNKVLKERLCHIYNILFKVYGQQRWWPADSPFEVIVGAILTQNTSWGNVEKAIANLKAKKKLSPKRLYAMRKKDLALLIRPCGYYNIKAKRLKNFMDYLFLKYKGSLRKFFSNPTNNIRQQLLAINGIGPETADSILLYAAERPIFVVDAYTKRLLNRQGLINDDASYESIQQIFGNNLPKGAKLFNEYHALIVRHAKNICKKQPRCRICVLRKGCAFFLKE